jgi:hypothetical protein
MNLPAKTQTQVPDEKRCDRRYNSLTVTKLKVDRHFELIPKNVD